MKFAGADLSAILGRTHGRRVDEVALIKVTAGAMGSNPTAGRSVTSSSYAARGYLDDYDDSQIDGTLVEEGDRRVVIYAATLADGIVPTQRDRISRDGEVFVIVSVRQDMSGARYVCQARSGGLAAVVHQMGASIVADATVTAAALRTLQMGADITASATATAAGTTAEAVQMGADITADVTVVASATRTVQAGADVTAAATATAAATRSVQMGAAIAASASTTASATRTLQMGADVTADATATAAGTLVGAAIQMGADITASATVTAAATRTTPMAAGIGAAATATAAATRTLQMGADVAASAAATAAATRTVQLGADIAAAATSTAAATRTLQMAADVAADATATATGVRTLQMGADVAAAATATAAGAIVAQMGADIAADATTVAAATRTVQMGADVSAAATATAAATRTTQMGADITGDATATAAGTLSGGAPTVAWEMDYTLPPTQEIHSTASAVAAACSSGASPFAIWITDGASGDVVDDVGTLDMTPANSPLRDRVATGLCNGTDAKSIKSIEFAASTNLIRTAAHTNFSLDADCAFAFPYRWGAYTGSNAQVFSTRTTNGEGIWVRGIGSSLIIAVTNGVSQTGTVTLTTEGLDGSWDFVVVMWDSSASTLYAYLASDQTGGSAWRGGTVTSALSTVTTVGGGYYASFIGQIPFIYAWTGSEAAKIVDYDDVAGLWTHGGDKPALLSTAKLNGSITCPVGYDATFGTYLATYRGDGTHAVDQIPWMHQESASKGGLLSLRSITNLLTYSQNFSLWTSTDCSTQIGNDKSPMGTRTATKITATGSNSRTRLAATVANGTVYYLSVYARTISGTATSRLAIYDSADTTEKTGGDISVTTVWQRFEIPWTSDTAGTVNPQIQAGVRGSASGEIIQIFGAMLCTIPDAPLVYTRGATASMTGTDYRYASAPFTLSDEGMVQAKFSLLTDDNGEDHFVWKRGGSSDSLYARLDSAENMDVGLNDSTPTLVEVTNAFASLDLTTLIDFWARWHVSTGGISDSATANEALDLVRSATSQDSGGTPVITVGTGAADFHVGQDDSAANNLDGIINYIGVYDAESDIGDLPA